MAVYKIDIQFRYQTEYWTNKFYINAPSQLAAGDWVDDAVAVLLPAIQNSVVIDKARITPAPFIANTFQDKPINLAGTGGVTQPAPLFNVVRWEFGKGFGRRIFHYFRGGVTPSNIGTDQQFTPAAKTFNDGIVAALGALEYPLTDRNGMAFISFTTALQVGMRQLRRGSKRKSSPVI